MKIIDLLNKIANGEEIPKKIKWQGQEWKYNPINDYEGIKYGGCLLNQVTLDRLNDEVEIIEEVPSKEEIKKITNKFMEAWKPVQEQFGKLFNELLRMKKDLGLNLEDKIEEDKKIEKIEVIPYEKCIHEVTHKEKEILLEIRDVQMKFNKIIDYLMENKQ